jgi:signal transduction histidine kinase
MASEQQERQGVSVKTLERNKTDAAVLGDLRRLERLFADCEWPARRVFVQARTRARARALAVLDGSGPGADATRTALLVAAAELFRSLRVELAASAHDAGGLAQQLQDLTGLPGIALAREVLRSPELLTAPPDVAVEVLLATLIAFAPLRSASLWTLSSTGHISCVCHVGEGSPSRGARQLGQRLLGGEGTEPTGSSARRLLLGLPVGRWQQPLAVLVGYARPWMQDRCDAFLAEAVPMLGAALERDSLLSGNAASERALVESSERKLTRLGFDLHDGPIQDVAVLAEDLRLFRDQLKPVLGLRTQEELVRGRIEDLDAQLVALDAELRRLASEVHAASGLLKQPFEQALRERLEAFAVRTSIEPRLTLEGGMNLISASQQIALLNIIHEALSNIREHADATKVAITVSADANGVQARVLDNGRGFDLETTLMRAARRGRVGLLAINERTRLLGGQCRIESRPGGPTVISVAFERWLPLLAETRSSRKSA